MADPTISTQTPTTPVAPTTSVSTSTSSVTQSDPNYLNSPPSDAEVKTVLQAIQDNKRQLVGVADTSDLDAAAAQARQLYQDRASRAEWMGVAERVGDAMAKFGVAGEAIKGHVDVSQFKDVTPTDITGSIGRYAQDYSTQLGALSQQRQARIEQQGVAQGQSNLSFQDQQNAQNAALGFEKEKYGQQSSDYRQSLRDAVMMNREDARSNRSDIRADTSQQRQMRQLQATDLQKQLQGAELEKRDAVIAASALASQDDLSPKSVAHLEQTMPGLLGRAGITPEQLADINKQATTQGWFTSDVDPAKRNQLIQQQVIQNKNDKISSLRDALNHVLGTPGTIPSATSATPPPDATKTVTSQQLQDYAAKHFPGRVDGMDASRKFLTSQGYTIQDAPASPAAITP